MNLLNHTGFFQDECTVALHFSTDGVRLFRNSKKEVWPFLLLNLNIRPEERYINLSTFLMCRYKVENFLPLGLCPGPSSPKDLDSFLRPFLRELHLLHRGVPAWDAHSNSQFLLKAHLVLVTGDTPAVSKMLHLNGHTAKRPCRACHIEGAPYYKTTMRGKPFYYYPLLPPNKFPEHFSEDPKQVFANVKSYRNPDTLPLRSKEDYLRDGQASSEDPRLATSTGVKGVSPFATIPTMSIPQSSPFDMMHLVFLGLVPDLCDLIKGTYFKDMELNEHPARLTTAEWIEFGEEMAEIDAPTSYGRNPRDIQLNMGQFKAEDWSNFLIHYLLPLSINRVDDITYKALQRLVFAISLAISYEVSYQEMDEIEHNLWLFSKWYYDTFYGREYERLPACKYTIHCLLHLAADIRNWGSASLFWQFAEV